MYTKGQTRLEAGTQSYGALKVAESPKKGIVWYPSVRYTLVVASSLSLALTTAFCVAILDREPAEAAPRYEVSVWYPGWGTAGSSDYDSVSENISTIDNISPYWYALKPDGSITAYEWAEDPKLLSLAREHDKPVTPLVSNEFDPARVSRMLSTESSRAVHVEDLVQLIVSNGYAGLDLDYEMLWAKDRDRFSHFVKSLASRLHDRGKTLSIAVHPKTSEPGTWGASKAQDWKRLGRSVDEFRIMTYDYHWNGSEAGPAAPPDWIDEVLSFAESQVSSHKIRMGLPFYGRVWKGTVAQDLVYDEVRGLIDKHSARVRRHSSGELYFKYAGGHTVYYQDSHSLSRKLHMLIRKHPNVGGVTIWHVGGEYQRNWNVINEKLRP